ncbi:MAG: hypothetical protein ACTSRK_00770 [Promethearchaeota archaeon]
MDEELKKAMEEGQILSIGKSKSQRSLSNLVSSSYLSDIKLHLAEYNPPIGVDFEKNLPVSEYLTYRAVLEIILQQEKLSKQKRYDVEQLLFILKSGNITEFLSNLTNFLEKADSKKRFCINYSHIILLTLRRIIVHVTSKDKINYPKFSLDKIAKFPLILDSNSENSEIVEKISIFTKSNPSDQNYKDLGDWSKLLLWSNCLLFHFNQFSKSRDKTFVKILIRLIENQGLNEAIDLINSKISGEGEKSIPSDNDSKPLSKLTNNQIILTILWGMNKILQ